jgi:hypothetical protein
LRQRLLYENGCEKVTLWAGQWRSKNSLDGKIEHVLYENCLPVLFRTRKDARDYIQTKYGYIKTRTDLREEPFGWRMPKVVKVEIKEVK